MPNMVLDPRYMDKCWKGYKFRFSVNRRTLTITRIDEDAGWDCGFCLRAYLPTENIPDCTSTVYTYHGLHGERAPEDVTEVIFHPSATIIQTHAFFGCHSLERITIPDTITQIEQHALSDTITQIEQHALSWCISLRFIRLSTHLKFIGMMAFCRCKLIEAVFLPPTVRYICSQAFHDCTSLRFCILPDPIDRLGHSVVRGCVRLSTTVRNNLSKVCYSTSFTPQTIQDCVDTHGIECSTEVNDRQMSALHILCANPHVTGDCIRAYLQLTPVAAEQQDSDGMTPFQYLCRNDITFLEDRSFSSVMAWWYGCMPPQTETGTKRKCG